MMQFSGTVCGEKQGLFVMVFWQGIIELEPGEMSTLDLLVKGDE